MKLTIELTDIEAELLAVLDKQGNPEDALKSLALLATSGVYRLCSWEREWLYRAFGDSWTDKLEHGDPWKRPAKGVPYFQRPIRAKRKAAKCA